LSHERLAIVDPASGKQPLLSEDKQLVLKGEELRKQFEGKYKFQTESDCEVILAYKEKDLIYR
jgi:asparagine synthase (glutamine-hydrolysing)